GLHFSDIEHLTQALLDLREAGNSIVIIEHNLEVVACADWVIDMGPEGGDGGGRIVAEGTPADVAQVAESHTGAALKDILAAIAEREAGRPWTGRSAQPGAGAATRSSQGSVDKPAKGARGADGGPTVARTPKSETQPKSRSTRS